MSTDIDQTCYVQDSAGCDCEMITLPGPFTATTVAGKVVDTFQMYGLQGINGTTVLLNGNVIEIDGGGGVVDLQTAYDGGNTIVLAGGVPVDISTPVGVNQEMFNIHDVGPTGLFSIDNIGLPVGDANIVLSNESGLTFNNPIAAAAPTASDPLTRLAADAAPSAVNVASTVANAINVAAISPANAVYSFTIPANSVSLIDLSVIAQTAALGSFAGKILVKVDPNSATQALVISNQTGADPGLAGATLDVSVVGGDLLVAIVGGPATNYVSRNFSTVSTYL
jgi:hypothetical protein